MLRDKTHGLVSSFLPPSLPYLPPHSPLPYLFLSLLSVNVVMFGLLRLFEWFTHGHIVEGVGLLLVLLLLPLITRAMWQQWRIYRAFTKVPCDPEMHFIFGHALKMVKDMGATLDWIRDLTNVHRWKSFKVSYGPALNMFICVHPDTARIALRSG